jgi:zinc protease
VRPLAAGLVALLVVAPPSATVCGAQRVTLLAPANDGRIVPADSLTIDYDVGGVHVIQRPTYANNVVSVQLYLLGGTRQLTPATAGIERLALEAASEGSGHYPGIRSSVALRRTGSRVGISSGFDWTVFQFVGLADQFDSTWAVFADRIVAPTLDSAAVATTCAKLRVEARRRHEQPDSWVRSVADSMMFAGHPYAIDPNGTVESMDQLTSADVRRYVTDQYVTSRMLLVIVGTVPRERVERAVATTLGTRPHGTYAWTPPPPLTAHDQSAIAVINHPLNTNYLLGYYAGPAVTSSDYAAFHAATELLGSDLSTAIRERRSLSYAATAPYHGGAIAVGGLYASSIAPSLVVPVMRDQIRRLTIEQIDGWRLREYLDQFITQYYQSHETNSEQGASLARAQIYWGDYRRADAEFEAFRRVTPYDLGRAADRYMRHIQFAYLGDPRALDVALIKQF